jgi:signal recognition particle subunit SRP54
VAGDLIDRVRAKAVGTDVLKSVDAGQMIVKIFHDELVAMLAAEGETFTWAKGRPTVLLLAGLQGSGKTTTAAKLAVHLRDKHQRRPLLVAADLQRPAAVDQLRVLGAANDIPVFHATGLTPEAVSKQGVAEAARTGRDTVLVDTAGRLHIDQELMDELVRVRAAISPDTTFLVCDAMTGQDAVRSAQAFVQRLPLDGVILTKLDGDTRGGAALSVRHVTGAPVRFVGVGEKVEDLQPFHADRMAGRVLGMGDVVSLVEKAAEAVDLDDAKRMEEKMRKGQFTLEDFLEQLRQMKKLGSLESIVGMLPGGAEMLKQQGDLSKQEKEFKHMEAMICGMTPQERRSPQILNAKRRQRIAKGSGVSVTELNSMLNKFAQMQQMMKKMGKFSKMMGRMGGGLPGMLRK